MQNYINNKRCFISMELFLSIKIKYIKRNFPIIWQNVRFKKVVIFFCSSVYIVIWYKIFLSEFTMKNTLKIFFSTVKSKF
jgi:hypothetical protein